MIEVLKQALEALENKFLFVAGDGEALDIRANAITSLRQAIREHAMYEVQRLGQEIEQEPVGKLQEPTVERAWFTIAELNAWADKKLSENPHWVMPKDEPERDEPPPQRTEQEPVAWLRTSGIGSPVVTNEMFNAYPEMRLNFQTPLYTHPPQRTWIGLTDEQIVAINDKHYNIAYRDDFDADIAIARAIEAKLKQKNGFAEEKNND
jgi:hypothetical protein